MADETPTLSERRYHYGVTGLRGRSAAGAYLLQLQQHVPPMPLLPPTHWQLPTPIQWLLLSPALLPTTTSGGTRHPNPPVPGSTPSTIGSWRTGPTNRGTPLTVIAVSLRPRTPRDIDPIISPPIFLTAAEAAHAWAELDRSSPAPVGA